MRGGTYARALEVGFDEKQAAFFAHLSMDTRSEILCEIAEEKPKGLNPKGVMHAFMLLFGVFILGILMGAILS